MLQVKWHPAVPIAKQCDVQEVRIDHFTHLYNYATGNECHDQLITVTDSVTKLMACCSLDIRIHIEC